MITIQQFNDVIRIIQKLRGVGQITLQGHRIHSIFEGEITVEVWPATAWMMGSYKTFTHEDFRSQIEILRDLQITMTFDVLPKMENQLEYPV